MSRALEWRNPPAEALMSDMDWAAAELRRNPGRWARVRKDLKSKAVAAWRKQKLEVVAVPAESDPDLWDIYARGPEVAPQQSADRATASKPKGTAKPAVSSVAVPVVSFPGKTAAAPATAATAPNREAEEDAAWASRSDQEGDPTLIVPTPPPPDRIRGHRRPGRRPGRHSGVEVATEAEGSHSCLNVAVRTRS